VIQPKLIISPVIFSQPGKLSESGRGWACMSPMYRTSFGYGPTPLAAYLNYLFKQGQAYDPLLTHP